MSRPLVLGNGRVVVCLDDYGQIRNFYYPHPGREDQIKGHHHRIGVWINGKFSWTSDPGWEISIKYKSHALVGDTTFKNKSLGVKLFIEDAVHPQKDVFIKKITIKNLGNKNKEVKLFLNQHFHIGGDDIGDTVYYHPTTNSLVSFKGKRYFLINGLHRKKGFSQYATGAADEGSMEGTYKDAEDGILSKNPIEHGSVDSTVGFDIKLKRSGKEEIFYWIAVGKNFKEVKQLNNKIIKKSPSKLLKETEKHWRKWIKRSNLNFCNLNKDIVEAFKKSLLIISTHTSVNGAIIASLDTGPMGQKKDNYGYMWPRDGALITRSLDKSGYHKITDSFFNFCKDVISEEGYLYHKYLPDKSVGSSWHPWVKNGRLQLPIQEDETALVLYALWRKYESYQDYYFMKPFYDKFIKKAADFLVEYRDKKTNLPKESYDLWERKLGVHTFTCCTVYAGLIGASNFAKVFKKNKDSKRYLKAAEEVKNAMIKHLYDKHEKRFIRAIYQDENRKWIKDPAIDISTAYGLFQYRVLDVEDSRLKETMKKTIETLANKTSVGGFLRFENDEYFRIGEHSPGNPWFIATFWVAQYYIAKAKTLNDLKKAEELLEWGVKNSLSSGVMPEQLNPETGEPMSYTPLVWSHASFVVTIIKYLQKYGELNIGKK